MSVGKTASLPAALTSSTRAVCMHTNGCFSNSWAFILADPAPDAQLVDDHRALKDSSLTCRKTHFYQFKLDRFLRKWAHFLADDAVLLLGPREAAILVNFRSTNNLLLLVFQEKGGDGFDRTALAAGIAPVVAVSKPGN